MSTLETRAESVIAQTVINDFLFGDPSGKDFVNELGELKRYDELAQWTSQQWAELIKTCVGPGGRD